ncbi:MAG: type II secretion system minor pseudopilin GspI [Gammaproteobacteria bacterium]
MNRRLMQGARRPVSARRGAVGFTLVEVLVALVVVAIGLSALMITVSSTARTSGALRDKTLVQWMALNRLSEVRLNLVKFGQNTDTGEINYANRTWHYDTRYFDTTVTTMKRVVVRIYAGDAKTKGSPMIESTGFVGTSLSTPGSSNNTDWTLGTRVAASNDGTNGTTPTPAPVTLPTAPAGGQTSVPTPTPSPEPSQ